MFLSERPTARQLPALEEVGGADRSKTGAVVLFLGKDILPPTLSEWGPWKRKLLIEEASGNGLPGSGCATHYSRKLENCCERSSQMARNAG